MLFDNSKLNFIKMHSLGNDFMIIFDDFLLNKALIAKLADRKTGVGFDQLIKINHNISCNLSGIGSCAITIYNADGSIAETCGNGMRCVAWLMFQSSKAQQIIVSTQSHFAYCYQESDGIAVNMGRPKLSWLDIPLSQECDVFSLPIDLADFDRPMCINVGNPHVVFFCTNNQYTDIGTIGPKIESHELFPARTNVHIAQILAQDAIRMSTWERGSGLTNACGSGACAVAYLAHCKLGLAGAITVHSVGGTMQAVINKQGEICNSAPAYLIFMGSYDHCTNSIGIA